MNGLFQQGDAQQVTQQLIAQLAQQQQAQGQRDPIANQAGQAAAKLFSGFSPKVKQQKHRDGLFSDALKASNGDISAARNQTIEALLKSNDTNGALELIKQRRAEDAQKSAAEIAGRKAEADITNVEAQAADRFASADERAASTAAKTNETTEKKGTYAYRKKVAKYDAEIRESEFALKGLEEKLKKEELTTGRINNKTLAAFNQQELRNKKAIEAKTLAEADYKTTQADVAYALSPSKVENLDSKTLVNKARAGNLDADTNEMVRQGDLQMEKLDSEIKLLNSKTSLSDAEGQLVAENIRLRGAQATKEIETLAPELALLTQRIASMKTNDALKTAEGRREEKQLKIEQKELALKVAENKAAMKTAALEDELLLIDINDKPAYNKKKRELADSLMQYRKLTGEAQAKAVTARVQNLKPVNAQEYARQQLQMHVMQGSQSTLTPQQVKQYMLLGNIEHDGMATVMNEALDNNPFLGNTGGTPAGATPGINPNAQKEETIEDIIRRNQGQ